ncbi:MAG: 2-C-methyl-D-erythritol 4-phosphate cytidylyltransferase [Thermoanaerobaculia bacterium]
MSLHLLIPAAGRGDRLGGSVPKALVPIHGRPLLSFTFQAFSSIPFEKGIVLCPPGQEERFSESIRHRWPVAAGGGTRAESVEIGIDRLAPGPRDYVVIHDAARAFVQPEDVQAVIAAAEESGAAIAVLRIADTLKRWDGEWILGTLDRREVAAAATPQVFRGDILRRAMKESPPGTDEAARCESIGIRVAAVPVSRLAFKITFPEDLRLAEAIARDLTPRPPLQVERGKKTSE